MADAGRKAVVAGFDLSESSRRAVRWAAHEASSRRRPLLLVHVLPWPFEERTSIKVPGADDLREPLQQALRRELEVLAADCREIDPGLEVRNEMPFGDPAVLLGECAAEAELLVLGGPQIEQQLGVLGSTSAELLSRRSGAPVAVIRGSRDRPDSAPVVVGVDGSPASGLAIGFAYDFASRHGCELVAVHAWSDLSLDPFGRVQQWELPWSEVRGDAEQVLAESLAGWGERYPDVDVRRVVTPEKPAQALFREAQEASLLVVGSHGRGRIRRALLGSVSHAAVNRAPCPVAVLRAG
ncbi:universal stress protein [Saccharopolyspora phatthalungensis]|uniref:Nucleotide-binding universal stress UspA family protein n=1 Tax=Saccharopolyspora phatthalungensis TaxID=664693 RepID=A0A840QEI8_9PSEU|nr:universal stress protein [Saccharopolyspora phatthalungensis]MBB5158437.1 nucleotide-binding universal stress UspA family protein [Saccharopolyspora phatthalungensis]